MRSASRQRPSLTKLCLIRQSVPATYFPQRNSAGDPTTEEVACPLVGGCLGWALCLYVVVTGLACTCRTSRHGAVRTALGTRRTNVDRAQGPPSPPTPVSCRIEASLGNRTTGPDSGAVDAASAG